MLPTPNRSFIALRDCAALLALLCMSVGCTSPKVAEERSVVPPIPQKAPKPKAIQEVPKVKLEGVSITSPNSVLRVFDDPKYGMLVLLLKYEKVRNTPGLFSNMLWDPGFEGDNIQRDFPFVWFYTEFDLIASKPETAIVHYRVKLPEVALIPQASKFNLREERSSYGERGFGLVGDLQGLWSFSTSVGYGGMNRLYGIVMSRDKPVAGAALGMFEGYGPDEILLKRLLNRYSEKLRLEGNSLKKRFVRIEVDLRINESSGGTRDSVE